MVSNLVISGSASITLFSPSVSAAVATAGSHVSPLSCGFLLSSARPVLSALLSASHVSFGIGADHPVSSDGASSSSTMPAPTPVSTTLRSDTLKPSPFRLVMKVPLMTRTGFTP